MAKIQPMDLVKSMSGKLCGHSDISFAKKGDTQYTMKRCNKRTSAPSPAATPPSSSSRRPLSPTTRRKISYGRKMQDICNKIALESKLSRVFLAI